MVPHQGRADQGRARQEAIPVRPPNPPPQSAIRNPQPSILPDSGSDPDRPPLPAGFPWALTLALLLVALVEVAARQLPADALIPHAVGEIEYAAVAQSIELRGPADVCIVGSSRAREAVVPERIAQSCTRRLGRPITAANYACPGAQARETEAVVRLLLRRGRPKLILFGISPRQFLERNDPPPQVALFWDWAEWKRQLRAAPHEAVRLFPVVLRNHLGRAFRILRYRHKPGSVLADWLEAAASGRSASVRDLLRGRVFPRPARGECSHLHATLPDRSLRTHPVSDARARHFVGDLLSHGTFRLDGPQSGHIRDLIAACRRAGVPLVLFEIPLSDLLRRHLPPSILHRLRRRVREIAGGVPFVSLDALAIEFTDADFLEQSHLNYRGACRLTRRLLECCVLPALGRADAAPGAAAPLIRRPAASPVRRTFGFFAPCEASCGTGQGGMAKRTAALSLPRPAHANRQPPSRRAPDSAGLQPARVCHRLQSVVPLHHPQRQPASAGLPHPSAHASPCWLRSTAAL